MGYCNLVQLGSANVPTKRTDKHKKNPLLVPVDFSPASEAALLFAADLADSIGSPITVLHVVHDPGDAPGNYAVPGRNEQLRRMEDVAAEMLADFMARVQRENPALRTLQHANSTLVVGLPVPRIMEVVETLEPHMVIMGSSGRTALHRLLLGSKATQAVNICPVPITIVRAPDITDPGD